MKLQVKVPMMVVGILAIIGVISGGMALFFQQKAYASQFEHMAGALAGAVSASLEQGMLSGDNHLTQETMLRVADGEMVKSLTLFSPAGKAAASSDAAQIGQNSSLDRIAPTLLQGKRVVQSANAGGRHSISVVSPVLNGPECRACHSAETTILGAIEVDLDTTLVYDQARQQTILLAIFAALTFVAVGGGLAFALKNTVLNPLSRLAGLTRKVSEGDFSARAETHGETEIDMLARSFNDMASKVELRTRELEASQRELADLNTGLEGRIEQRTREVTELNARLEEMNRIRVQLLEKLINAQEEERRRIARELHDNASQSLAAVAINLGEIIADLPPRYSRAKDQLNMLKEQTVQTLSGIRTLALELRPGVLDDMGLPAAIRWYAVDYLGKRGLKVELDINGNGRLSAYAETMLFRIIQEALANVVKHAEATSVRVSLRVIESRAIVQIEDNGKGFDTSKVLKPAGLRQNLGIHGISERAALLNGTFSIRSEAGKGTIVCVELPLSENGGAREQQEDKCVPGR